MTLRAVGDIPDNFAIVTGAQPRVVCWIGRVVIALSNKLPWVKKEVVLKGEEAFDSLVKQLDSQSPPDLQHLLTLQVALAKRSSHQDLKALLTKVKACIRRADIAVFLTRNASAEGSYIQSLLLYTSAKKSSIKEEQGDLYRRSVEVVSPELLEFFDGKNILEKESLAHISSVLFTFSAPHNDQEFFVACQEMKMRLTPGTQKAFWELMKKVIQERKKSSSDDSFQQRCDDRLKTMALFSS